MLRFDINLIFTVVNLLVLYFLMKKFLFDKVNAIFRQRQELIDEDYAAAEAARIIPAPPPGTMSRSSWRMESGWNFPSPAGPMACWQRATGAF